MNSLIVGKTSQLNHYFPIEYDRISSRDIDFNALKDKYNRIYLLFAEQRTFLNENLSFFTDINVEYTLYVINELKDYCNNIIIYSTSELWNNYDHEVSIELPYNYNITNYIKSKEILCNYINKNKDKFQNINIIYPFNFNSPYRKQGFLFSKIFNSLIKKEKNIVGNLNFNRDIIHPKKIIDISMRTNEDVLIGTGELINIETFVSDLFFSIGLNHNDYLVYQNDNIPNIIRKEYFSKIKYSSYTELLELTKNDTTKNNVS